MRRIVTLIRDNIAQLRQVESDPQETQRLSRKMARAKKIDPKLAQIATQFSQFEIEKSRGGYLISHPGRSEPIARLRPIPDTDRFELFYWSNIHGRWRTGDTGRHTAAPFRQVALRRTEL
jgi:hypothetical protein